MDSLERLLHQWHLRKRKPTGFEALAVNYAVSQIAVGMLGSFGVLYIYSLGSNLFEGLGAIVVFFGLQRLATMVASPLMAKGICKIGYRWMMFLGLLSLAVKSWLMMLSGGDWRWLVPALMLGGFSIAGYYLGYHGIFLDDNDDDKIGEQMGLVTMAGRMALIVSPILAGFLVAGFGFEIMFGVAGGLLLVSLIPLFLIPHHEHQLDDFKINRVFMMIKQKKGFAPEVFWWNVENGIQTFFWPVFLFLIIGGYERFGMVNGGVMLISSLAVYGSGRIYDKRPLKRGQWLATGLVSLSYVLRFMTGNSLMAVGADGFNRLVSPFWWMRIRRRALMAGEEVKAIIFGVAWEWAVSLGYIVSLLVGFLLMWLSGGEWGWLALPAIIGIIWGAKNVED